MLSKCYQKIKATLESTVYSGFRGFCYLFPLNRSTRLRTQIVAHAVHVLYFVQNPVGNFLEDGPVDFFDGGGHGINSVDGAEDDGVFEASGVIADADGFKVWDNGKVLPYFFIQSGHCKFFSQDGVGFSDGFEAVTGNGTKAAYAKARAREGLTVDHIVWQTKLCAAGADFILEQLADRFDQLKL